jgi:5-(carboxyamino)imidazole ribonucleotide synthase
MVQFLFAPAEITAGIEKRAIDIAKLVIEKLEMVGLLAVELFLTKQGDIWVNEIAPRPHNSGHHTIEANTCSQYEQHLRAICDLPLGDAVANMSAVMVNLLGEKEYVGVPYYEGFNEVIQMPGVYVHLYGKGETKPFRKMGHVTIIDENMQKAKEKALEVKRILKVKTK